MYLVILERVLPSIVQPVPPTTKTKIWLMYDGAPDNMNADARRFLDVTSPRRCIGRERPVTRLSHSPDLNPLDFFV